MRRNCYLQASGHILTSQFSDRDFLSNSGNLAIRRRSQVFY